MSTADLSLYEHISHPPVTSWESGGAENGFHLPFLPNHFEFEYYILNVTDRENIKNIKRLILGSDG